MKILLTAALLIATMLMGHTSAANESSSVSVSDQVDKAIADIQDMASKRDSNDARITELRDQLDKLDRFDSNLQDSMNDDLAEVEASVVESGIKLGTGQKEAAYESTADAASSFGETYVGAVNAAGNEMTAQDLEAKIASLEKSNRNLSKSISNSIGALIAVGPIAMSGQAPAASSVFARVSAAYQRTEVVATVRENQRKERAERERREGRQEDKDVRVRGNVDVSDPDGEMKVNGK